MEINISKDYTKTPGGRFIKEGKFSGEHFREKLLEPSLLKAVKNNEPLIINLDDGYGYASCFLEEAFGGLIRKGYNPQDLLNIFIFISNEEPELIQEIKEYISENESIILNKKK